MDSNASYTLEICMEPSWNAQHQVAFVSCAVGMQLMPHFTVLISQGPVISFDK